MFPAVAEQRGFAWISHNNESKPGTPVNVTGVPGSKGKVLCNLQDLWGTVFRGNTPIGYIGVECQ